MFIQSALLLFLFFIVPQILAQSINTEFYLNLYNNTEHQLSNLSVFSIEVQLDTILTQNVLSQTYIQVEITLKNPFQYNYSSSQNHGFENQKEIYCEQYNCNQNVFMAVLFSFNSQDFQILYDNFDPQQFPPLIEYYDLIDYSAFLSQKRQHTLLIPASGFKKYNRTQVQIGVINLQSKMYQQSQEALEYSIEISKIVMSEDKCPMQCLPEVKDCPVKKQVCVCEKNFFDLDCSLYANAISNKILLTENYEKGSGGFQQISGDQIQLRQFIQELSSIETEQWIYQFLDIGSDFMTQQINGRSEVDSQLYENGYDIILTFQKSLFHNISLSYIFYGIDQIFTPNIFTNYFSIDNLQPLNQFIDKTTLLKDIQLTDQAQITIPWESVQNYKLNYENNKFFKELHVNPTILFGFYNYGKQTFLSSNYYAVNIKFRQTQRNIQSINLNTNQNKTESTSQSQSQLESSNIIIICVVSVIFLLAVILFLFRKKICPKRFMKKQGTQKNQNSNISVAGDSTPQIKAQSSSQSNFQYSNKIKLSQTSYQKSIKRLIHLNSGSKKAQNQQHAINTTSYIKHHQLSSFRNKKCLSSDQNEQEAGQVNQKQANQIESCNKKPKLSNSLPVTSQTCIMQVEKSSAHLNGNNNAQFSFQNGDKSFQSQNFFLKSHSRIEDLTDEQSNKQITIAGYAAKKGFLDNSKSQLNVTSGQQTMNQFNQMTTQAYSERKSFQADWNLIQFNNPHTLINIENEYDLQNNKRRISRMDNESLKQKKNSLQPLEIPVEEDEAQGASCDDSICQNLKKKQKFQEQFQNNTQHKNNAENLSQVDQMTQQVQNQQQNNVENNNQSGQSNQNNLSQNKTPNNLLFEKYILYGSSILKDCFKKSRSPEIKTKIKMKQRINYKINKRFRKRKIKKPIQTNEELDSDNVSIYMHLNPNSTNKINKKIPSRKNSANSSRYSANLPDSNSSRLSNRSIRKKQNTPKGVVSRFFVAQKKPNSSNNLRQKEKPFSVDLDISSMHKKIKLAESIFTGINHSSYNISLDTRELKSSPFTPEALDSPINTDQKEQQGAKQNPLNAQKTENSFTKKSIYQISPVIAAQNIKKLQNNNEAVSQDRISQKSQNNIMLNAQTPRVSPKNGFGVASNQILSFGLQKSNNIGEVYKQGGEVADQNSKGLLLPSYILNTSKKSDDLSTPGFIKSRNQNAAHSRPSTFFHQKFTNSPQRTPENYELEEEKQFNLNSHSNIDSATIKKCYHKDERAITPFNNEMPNKQSFDLNSMSIQEGENKMNEFNTSMNEATFCNNISFDEGNNKNSIYKNSYHFKNKMFFQAPNKEDKLTSNSQENEQIQINQIFFENFSTGLNFKKINTTKSNEYSLQQPTHDLSPPTNLIYLQNQASQNQNQASQSQIQLTQNQYQGNQNQSPKNEKKIIENQINEHPQDQDQDQQNEMRKQIVNPRAIFCQNGFLFTNLNQIKLNWENKVNNVTMSISEVSNNNNNNQQNFNNNSTSIFQNGMESYIKNIRHAHSHQNIE